MLKKIIGLAMAMVMTVGITATPTHALTASSSANKSTIVVNGIGTVVVKPDIAYLQVGYEARNKEAILAQNETKAKMSAILKAVKALGIKDADIKTTNISLYKGVDYNANNVKDEYYVSSNTVEVTVRNLDKVAQIIDAASDAGSNQMGQVRFAVENQEKYQLEALKVAVKSANNKAKAIADAIVVKIGKPSKVTENSYNGGIIYRDAMTMAKAEAAPATPVEVGSINIEVNVTVEYQY